MKRKAFNAFTALYISFYVIVAHCSLVAVEASSSHRFTEGGVVASSATVVRDNKFLARLDAEAYQGPGGWIDVQSKVSGYRVEAWLADWCAPCKRWKRSELPALLKAEVKVTLRNYDTDTPRPASVKATPTILLYCKGEFVKQRIGWKAKDLLEFIKQRKPKCQNP